MSVDFSKRGEPCTAFERALVAGADWGGSEGGAVWLRLVERVGIDAMLVVFDELGSEKVHVPTREYFFAALWRVQRDAHIRRRVAAGESPAAVAADFGLTRIQVYNIRNSAHGPDAGLQPPVVKGRG